MDNGYQHSASAIANTTHQVLKNTYMLLGLTMIPTVIGALMGVALDFSAFAKSPIMVGLLMLAIMFGLFFAIEKNKDSGVGVALLLLLTFLMGAMLGPLLQHALHFRNGSTLIGLAAGGTGVIFFSLASIAAVSKRDFGFLGNFLFIGLLLIILASVANLFLHLPVLSLTVSAISVLIFSGYILYDVNSIVRGGETNYVMATLNIYLDIYNLFTSLLRILMALFGED